MSGGAIFISYFLKEFDIIASPGELGCTFSHADNNKMVAYHILLHQYKLDNRLLLFCFLKYQFSVVANLETIL